MKIAFVSYRYHWDSFSLIRLLYEELIRREFEVKWFEKFYDSNAWDADLVFLVGFATDLSHPQKVPVIRFEFSDPNTFNKGINKRFDLYCTNDLRISRKGFYYLPCFCDFKYFNNLNLNKETDIIFIGIGTHPYVKERVAVVNDLRNKGFKI